MISTVQELIAALKPIPGDTPIMGEKFVQRWSGNPEDTDLSGYEDAPIKYLNSRNGIVIIEVEHDD